MPRSLNEDIRRCELRVSSLDKAVIKANEAVKTVIADARHIRRKARLEREALAELLKKRDDRQASGMKRYVLAADGLSPLRHIRFRQLLEHEYQQAGFEIPSFLAEISESDVLEVRTSDLIERYAVGDDKLSALIGLSEMSAVMRRIKPPMDQLNRPRATSEESKAIWDKHPAWDPAQAAEIAAQAQSDFGLETDNALHIGERNAAIFSSRFVVLAEDLWIRDSVSSAAERFFLGPRSKAAVDGPAGTAVLDVIDKRKEKSISVMENDARLLEAVAIHVTPGAVAHALRQGLSESDRQFSVQWFAANRGLVSDHYNRIGTELAFRDLVADPLRFRDLHAGSALKSHASHIWARKDNEAERFQKTDPQTLIEKARHDLIDTTLRSPLISLPKAKVKDDYIDLGPWARNESAHADVFDVSTKASKGFLAEARDAAEIQVMQGSCPMAITIGLVTWVSADGAQREAPLFLAMASFDADKRSISRLSPFNVNMAWVRRLAVEYPKMGKLDLITELPLGEPLESLFAAIADKINDAAGGVRPILSITDQSYVGVFDSSRSVLERRLNLEAFPALPENPIVRMLAEGADPRIVEAPYKPREGRSGPDEIQMSAVRAALGGTSFVLEGPPGTGKTQTIFEMVVALVAAGKRVLISAAMPGAVEVIGRRMRGHLTFTLCVLRPGQIDIGGTTSKADVRETKYQTVIGTPLALTGRLRADDKFDVLIIDEASQLRLSHALALSAYASQIIVAGDSRQLQPRDSETGEVTEMSLLMRARLAGFPAITLKAHYRSQHPSLIAWSNLYAYESQLRPKFGPVLYGETGFSVVYVAPGRRIPRDLAQVNVEEADRIADECVRWARDGRRSVGVAAMTLAQRDLIRETVEARLAKAGLSAATAAEDNRFFSKEEPFFVRTAGAVQGEERDVLLISLGVAPDKTGRISQRIGVLSRNDCLALCNVMLSRSRLKTTVYSSIVPSDIELSAMTPAMFLVASILRMATVVAYLEKPVDRSIGIDVKTVDRDYDFFVDRLDRDGETFYGVRLFADPDRYAFAMVPCETGKTVPLIETLQSSGWKVFSEPLRNFSKPLSIVMAAAKNRLYKV